MKTFITTYNRKEMLTSVVNNLNSYGIEPTIYDDGSDYDHEFKNYKRHNHRGKEGFWQTWNEILIECAASDEEYFLFMPDDFHNLNIGKLYELRNQLKKPFACNIINDGRRGVWTGIVPVTYDNYIMCGMVDCGFFCNREALERIGFFMNETKDETASGVGKDLSQRFLKARVPMYKPIKSLAYHGDHESQMNPEERKKNPLISL